LRPSPKVTAIVPSAGLGKRLGLRVAKPFVHVLGKPLFIHTLFALKKADCFFEIILAVDEKQRSVATRHLKHFGLGSVRVVAGGDTRSESVQKALEAVSEKSDWVLIHDAARPLVSRTLVFDTLRGARKTGAAIAAMPAFATVKRSQGKSRVILRTENRDLIYLAQTPQVFRRELLEKQYRALGRRAFDRTDDASLFDGSAVRVMMVPGQTRNIKVTTPEDLELFKFYLKGKK
jgi:2-C-methyl-D-erythritol 4-phosphate cytidylyltransferase